MWKARSPNGRLARCPHLIYDTLSLEEERIEQNRRYDSSNHNNRRALRSLKEKITALMPQWDDLSLIHSSRSKRSRVSRRSKQSTSISSLQKRAQMAAKAARLEAKLQFPNVESLKTATLKKKEDEIKKLQMVKELTATHSEMEAVNKKEREHYRGLNSLCDEILAEDNGSEDHLETYLQSQLDSTLPPKVHTSTSEVQVQISLEDSILFVSPFSIGTILPHGQPKA